MRTIELEDALDVLIDYRGKTPEKSDHGVLLVTAKVIKDGFILSTENEYVSEDEYERWMRRGLPREGDVLITTEAPLGQVARIDDPRVALAQRVILLRARRGVLDASYLYHVLQGPRAQDELRKRATGTTVAGIKQSELRRVPLLVPDLDTQRRTAIVLDAIGDLIDNNLRRIRVLEETAQRLFHEWVIAHDSRQVREPASDVAEYVNGFAFKPSDFASDGAPIIKIRELKSGVDDSTPRFLGELAAKYRVKPGCLLFSWSADLDVYIWSGVEGWLNQHLFIVRPRADVPISFLYHALRFAMPEFRALSNGATMKHIKRSALASVHLTMATAELRQKFAAKADPIVAMILNLSARTENLRKLRDRLLPKLLSGELDVSRMPLPPGELTEAIPAAPPPEPPHRGRRKHDPA